MEKVTTKRGKIRGSEVTMVSLDIAEGQRFVCLMRGQHPDKEVHIVSSLMEEKAKKRADNLQSIIATDDIKVLAKAAADERLLWHEMSESFRRDVRAAYGEETFLLPRKDSVGNKVKTLYSMAIENLKVPADKYNTVASRYMNEANGLFHSFADGYTKIELRYKGEVLQCSIKGRVKERFILMDIGEIHAMLEERYQVVQRIILTAEGKLPGKEARLNDLRVILKRLHERMMERFAGAVERTYEQKVEILPDELSAMVDNKLGGV